MDEPPDSLMISALQHYAYCPRQFALIHVEQVWAENYFTAEGQVLHERVDSQEFEQRGDRRYERSVAVKSSRLGLRGKLDLLEIDGDTAKRYYPVEYKRGKAKTEDWDKIQLCAQALCLEEMLDATVNEGALWYWKTRKRLRVTFEDSLRQLTLEVIEAAKKILRQGCTPPPITDKKRCRACSLNDICQPQWFTHDRSGRYTKELFSS